MGQFDFVPPEDTHTIDQYIESQSEESMNYSNTSFKETYKGLQHDIYNITSDYIDELRSEEYTVMVVLSDEQLAKYKYRPKLLSYDLYKNTELYFLILLINDMSSCKQFTKKKLLLPTTKMMSDLSSQLINANKQILNSYSK